MKTLLAIAITALVLFASWGCSMTKERYLITFHETPRADIENLNTPTEMLEAHGGRHIVLPIENQGPIVNPALPAYVSRVPGNFITVLAFPSAQAARSYVAAAPQDSSTQVLAKIFKPMPVMPDMPVIGSIEHREAPSFILLNGISMNSMANPMTMIRMMRYMGANFSKLKQEGVVMLASFEALEVLRGEYPFDMLFLTEWPSTEVFDRIHSDGEFVNLARKTRNRAFNHFADDRGVIRFDLSNQSADPVIDRLHPSEGN